MADNKKSAKKKTSKKKAVKKSLQKNQNKLEENKIISENSTEKTKAKKQDKSKLEKKLEKEKLKTQKQEHAKILRNFLLFLGLFAILALSIYVSINIAKHFNYNGLDFERVKEGKLIFYNTKVPLYSPNTGEKVADFNVYLRNDPRELDKIPFEGEIDFRQNMVLNTTEELNCNGKGVLAIANILNFYNNVLGTKIISDENASCDSESRYMYLNIKAGANLTEVIQTGEVCYQINVKDCEVLAGAEKFILESILEIKQRQEN